MKVHIMTALAIGIWAMVAPGQPKERIVQRESTANAKTAAETQQKQQPANEDTIKAILMQELHIQQQNSQILKDAQGRSNQDIAVEGKLVKYTRALVWVGAIQFAALVVQAVVFFVTFLQMRETSQRQLRAYVCVPVALLKFKTPEVPEIQIHLKNSGQTPAYDVQGWIHLWIEEYPLKIILPEPPEDFQKSKEVMGPECVRIFVNTKNPPIPTDSLPSLGTPNGTIYAYGEVRYKDAFGVKRYTKYRFIYGGSQGVRKSKPDAEGVVTALLTPDTDGNEAN